MKVIHQALGFKYLWEILHELVTEGLSNKLARMPEDAQFKIQETLQRIINEGSGGLICIILLGHK